MAVMIKAAFTTLIYDPLYNALIFLIDIVPHADVGIAVILLTIFVKFVLFPLSLKAVKTQIALRAMEPELKEIKEKNKDNQHAQALAMMELYRKYEINPFSSILLILIQLPIIFGLYWVFFKGGLPVISPEHLYSFIPSPQDINMHFLGLVDVASTRNILFTLLVGITQYIQIRLTLPALTPRKENASFQEDFSRSMNLNMRYVLPVVVTIAAYFLSVAIGLYWITSNIFAIGQEFYVRRHIKKPEDTAHGSVVPTK